MSAKRFAGSCRSAEEKVREYQHAKERFAAELAFAEGLAELYPNRAGRWKGLIGKARDLVAQAEATGKAQKVVKAVADAERDILAPIAKVAKTYTIHCVGHAHIDMNWQWSWPETVACVNDTFTTVLKLMERFPRFCFTQSQAAVYDIVRRYNPPMLEKIRRRIAEGRWEVAAVQWVEGDKNMASGESLARHLLYTRRFLREHLGLRPEDVPLDWEPDTSGHAATIPSIISRGGARWYYLCRGGRFEKPPVFWWEGPDGSRVLANLEMAWYGGVVPIGQEVTDYLLRFCRQTKLKDWMFVFGVGDHGGGPTSRDLLGLERMNAYPVYPNFTMGTAAGFFRILEAHGAELPVVRRELNFEWTGCYSAVSNMKTANRIGENLCLSSEAAAAIGHFALGRDYPAEELRQAWINILFGHFHDILPGCGHPLSQAYQLGLFQNTGATASIITTETCRALAERIDTAFAPGAEQIDPEGGDDCMGRGPGCGTRYGAPSLGGHAPAGLRAFALFNLTPEPREEIVVARLWDSGIGDPAGRSYVLRGPDGQAVPAQQLRRGNDMGHKYVSLAFPAAVGAMGYSAFVLQEGQGPPAKATVQLTDRFDAKERQQVNPQFVLENEHIAATFDSFTGGIIRLIDQATGRDLARPDDPLGVLEYVVERPVYMSSCLVGDPKTILSPLELSSLDVVHRGPYIAAIQAKTALNDSRITVTYSLGAGQRFLQIEADITWVEHGSMEFGAPSLRMKFPLNLTDAKLTCEIPYGAIERDLSGGEHVPALCWADANGRLAGQAARAGSALLNDSRYAHSLDGSTLRLVLLRTSYGEDPLPDTGRHKVRMALVPHGKALAAAELTRLGSRFNHPMVVLPTDVHAGDLPSRVEGLQAGPANVVLSCVKKGDDSDALIVRLFETAGKETSTARVALDNTLFGEVQAAVETDLLERPLAAPTAKAVGNGFTVRLGAHAITTVAVTLARPLAPKKKKKKNTANPERRR